MGANIIQAQYEELKRIAATFNHQAGETEQLDRRLLQQVSHLQNGGWVGKGANAFYAEIDQIISPALRRLHGALCEAQNVTLQISQVMQQAEEEAAALFQGSESPFIALFPGGENGIGMDTGPENSGPFRIGPPQRPDIQHDNGFLDIFPPREPTLADRASLLKWRTILEGAEVLRPDLVDGLAAYRHFLDRNGADRYIDYERYIANDPAGQISLNNLIVDAQRHVEIIGQGRDLFSVTSDAYTLGGDDARFPYPQTENWEKALGGHNVWTSADVQVSGSPPDRMYTMLITMHMEDRYNFNPNQHDIATGIPDEANGIFEITGLAKQYMNYGQITRTVTWQEGDIQNAEIANQDSGRLRQPPDNRRLRNRV